MLGNTQSKGSDTGVEVPFPETVTAAGTFLSPFVGLSTQLFSRFCFQNAVQAVLQELPKSFLPVFT